MAPGERIEVMRLAAEIALERTIGVLFIEHDMDVVFAHATRVMVLDRGRLLAIGTPRQVRANPRCGRSISARKTGGERRPGDRPAKLEAHKLDCFYGRAQILFGVTLKVAAGEAVALLGRNGAGKTTTLRSIIGLARNTRGPRRLRWAGNFRNVDGPDRPPGSATCRRTGASSPT